MALPRWLRLFFINLLYWALAALLFVFMRNFGLEETNLFVRTDLFAWKSVFVLASIMTVVVAIITTLMDKILLGRRLIRISYSKVVLTAFGLNAVAFLVVIFILFQIVTQLRVNVIMDEPSFFHMLLQPPSWVFGVFYAVASFGLIFLKQLDFKLGPGNLLKIIMGRYHQPREEELAIMFLDLKSSTTAAEQMGPLNYSRMIKDVFFDITDAVTEHKASIYQYVGDEVILVWPLDEGEAPWEAVHLFYDFIGLLEEKKAWYNERYNWTPEFKAAIHLGKVVVTEVGFLKREIAYHGDVLNTTSRVMDLCKPLGRSLLITGEFSARLATAKHQYQLNSHGTQSLRGKEELVEVVGVEHKQD